MTGELLSATSVEPGQGTEILSIGAFVPFEHKIGNSPLREGMEHLLKLIPLSKKRSDNRLLNVFTKDLLALSAIAAVAIACTVGPHVTPSQLVEQTSVAKAPVAASAIKEAPRPNATNGSEPTAFPSGSVKEVLLLNPPEFKVEPTAVESQMAQTTKDLAAALTWVPLDELVNQTEGQKKIYQDVVASYKEFMKNHPEYTLHQSEASDGSLITYFTALKSHKTCTVFPKVSWSSATRSTCLYFVPSIY